MSKISVIGICGMSVFMAVDHFHENGETLVADSMYGDPGGKGFNQAIAAKRMGAEVSFLAAAGCDSDGDSCVNFLKEEDIDARIVRKEGKKTAVAFILTDKNGENRVTEYKSAELVPGDVALFESYIAESDILLLQNEVSEEVNLAAARLAKKHGVKVILNPAPAREISDELAEAVYMVTPNEQEAKMISPSRFENVITTLGSKGCDINGKVNIPTDRVKAVDTTGAGDTFNGVLAAYLAEGRSLEEACRYAVKAASISVTRRGVFGAIPHRNEIEDRS